jgi:acyl dehydratase
MAQQEPVITDEMLEGLRYRIEHQIPTRATTYPATEENIMKFARGYGDLNPLYRPDLDSEYADKTRWEGIIAPPMFVTAMQVKTREKKRELTKEERERGKGGGLPGIHGFYSGDDIDFLQVIRPGDMLTSTSGQAGFEEKKSKFARRAIHMTNETVYKNQRGEIVAVARTLNIRAERGASRQEGKYSNISIHNYTKEEWEAIEADYDKEEIRGANPRYWEDVSVGDELTPVIKGPYTAFSTLCLTVGIGGPPGFLGGVNAEAHRMRKSHPGAFSKTSHGFYDNVGRIHWDHEMAHEMGLPAYYDYGGERICSMAHLITNWMGDDGFLRKLDGQFRIFNFYGDTTWVKGKVTDKYIKDNEHLVDIEISCVNQRGDIHAPGHATVLLPSKVHGPMVLPAKLDRPITFG